MSSTGEGIGSAGDFDYLVKVGVDMSHLTSAARKFKEELKGVLTDIELSFKPSPASLKSFQTELERVMGNLNGNGKKGKGAAATTVPVALTVNEAATLKNFEAFFKSKTFQVTLQPYIDPAAMQSAAGTASAKAGAKGPASVEAKKAPSKAAGVTTSGQRLIRDEKVATVGKGRTQTTRSLYDPFTGELTTKQIENKTRNTRKVYEDPGVAANRKEMRRLEQAREYRRRQLDAARAQMDALESSVKMTPGASDRQQMLERRRKQQSIMDRTMYLHEMEAEDIKARQGGAAAKQYMSKVKNQYTKLTQEVHDLFFAVTQNLEKGSGDIAKKIAEAKFALRQIDEELDIKSSQYQGSGPRSAHLRNKQQQTYSNKKLGLARELEKLFGAGGLAGYGGGSAELDEVANLIQSIRSENRGINRKVGDYKGKDRWSIGGARGAFRIAEGVMIGNLAFQAMQTITDGFKLYVNSQESKNLVKTYAQSAIKSMMADGLSATQAAFNVTGGQGGLRYDKGTGRVTDTGFANKTLQDAKRMSLEFGATLHEVQQAQGLWLKQMKDIRQANYMTARMLEFGAATNTDQEKAYRLMTSIAMQMGKETYAPGQQRIPGKGTFRPDYGAATDLMMASTILASHMGPNLKDTDASGIGINNPQNAAQQMLQALGEGGGGLMQLYGYTPKQSLAWFSALQQTADDTGAQLVNNVGSILAALSSDKGIGYLNTLGIKPRADGTLFEMLSSDGVRQKVLGTTADAEGNVGEIGLKKTDLIAFLNILKSAPNAVKAANKMISGDLDKDYRNVIDSLLRDNPAYQANRISAGVDQGKMSLMEGLFGGDYMAKSMRTVAESAKLLSPVLFAVGRGFKMIADVLGIIMGVLGMGLGASLLTLGTVFNTVYHTIAGTIDQIKLDLKDNPLVGRFISEDKETLRGKIRDHDRLLRNPPTVGWGMAMVSGGAHLVRGSYNDFFDASKYSQQSVGDGFGEQKPDLSSSAEVDKLNELRQSADRRAKEDHRKRSLSLDLESKAFREAMLRIDTALTQIDSKMKVYEVGVSKARSAVDILAASENRLNAIYRDRIPTLDMLNRQQQNIYAQADAQRKLYNALGAQLSFSVTREASLRKQKANLEKVPMVKPSPKEDMQFLNQYNSGLIAVPPNLATGAARPLPTLAKPVPLKSKKEIIPLQPKKVRGPSARNVSLRQGLPPLLPSAETVSARQGVNPRSGFGYAPLPSAETVAARQGFGDATKGRLKQEISILDTQIAQGEADLQQAYSENDARRAADIEARNKQREEERNQKARKLQEIEGEIVESPLERARLMVDQMNAAEAIYTLQNRLDTGAADRNRLVRGSINERYNILKSRTLDPINNRFDLDMMRLDRSEGLYGSSPSSVTSRIKGLQDHQRFVNTNKFITDYRKWFPEAEAGASIFEDAADVLKGSRDKFASITEQYGGMKGNQTDLKKQRQDAYVKAAWVALVKSGKFTPNQLRFMRQNKGFQEELMTGSVDRLDAFAAEKRQSANTMRDALKENEAFNIDTNFTVRGLKAQVEQYKEYSQYVDMAATSLERFNEILEMNKDIFERTTGQDYGSSDQRFTDLKALAQMQESQVRNSTARIQEYLSGKGVFANVSTLQDARAFQDRMKTDPEFMKTLSTQLGSEENARRIQSDVGDLIRLMIESMKNAGAEGGYLTRIARDRRNEDQLTAAIYGLPTARSRFDVQGDILGSRLSTVRSRYQSAYQAFQDQPLTAGKSPELTSDLLHGPGEIYSLENQLKSREITQGVREGFTSAFRDLFSRVQEGGVKGGSLRAVASQVLSPFASVYQNAMSERMVRKYIEPSLDRIPGYRPSYTTPKTPSDIATSFWLPVIARNTGMLAGVQMPSSTPAGFGSGVSTPSIKLGYNSGGAGIAGLGVGLAAAGVTKGEGSSKKYNPAEPAPKGYKWAYKDGQPVLQKMSKSEAAAQTAMEYIGYGAAAMGAYNAGAQGGPVQGALGGVMLGATFGPVGMAIGGVLGLVGGLFGRHKKGPEKTDYDPLFTPKDVMWAQPGFRPFSAFAGGRALPGMGTTLNINVNVTGVSDIPGTERAAKAGAEKGVNAAMATTYRRERDLGQRAFI